MDLLEAGKISNTHGFKGEVKIIPWTDDPSQFETFPYLRIFKNNEYEKLFFSGIKYQKNNIIVRLSGIDTIEQAEKLINTVVYAERDFFNLNEGSYFIKDLIGLSAVDKDGATLGKISDVISAGGSDVYVIETPEHKQILIPAIKQVVKKIDLKNGLMLVELIEGLI